MEIYIFMLGCRNKNIEIIFMLVVVVVVYFLKWVSKGKVISKGVVIELWNSVYLSLEIK